MLDVVLCEFEGVLADTSALRRRALQRSFADESLALADAEYDAHCAGLPLEGAIRAGLRAAGIERDDTGVEVLRLRAERHFAELAGKGVSLATGAREFLDRAQGATRLALVTRASRREVEFVLGLAGLDGAFECIVAAEDVLAPKPAPEGYRRALERLARRRPLARERAVALEDGPAGVRAARGAGVRCIVVGTLPAHIQVEADAALPSVAGHSPSTLDALLNHREETVE
jgi:HAD superfamily hydrolase (TIGR01509 family)